MLWCLLVRSLAYLLWIADEDASSVGAHVDAAEEAWVAGNLLDPGKAVLGVVDALPGLAVIE
jgi:hypothetical protein